MEKAVVRRQADETKQALLKDYHPLLQRIFSTRGIEKPDQLQHELKHLLPYADLKGVQKAVRRIATAIDHNERILVIGDYDVDGATSTALAVDCMRACGGQLVDFLVPNRFEYGYGLTPEIVAHAVEEKSPDLIITVDNGITSAAGVDAANKQSIDVIITDHHLPGDTVPEAFAIVNPNQSGDAFPSKCLAGVGVIFYVMMGLRSELSERNWFQEEEIPVPNLADYLDLVALGTIADVVPLDKNNRILVHQGLQRIRAGRCRSGIRAMLEVSRRKLHQLTGSDLGYAVAPRLNAAGRLDDMSLGVRCLLSDSMFDARVMATRLDELNMERREIENHMQDDADELIDQIQLEGELPVALVLYNEGWHQGVVGLVASRLKERLHRPIVAMAKTDDNTVKGSARSVKGVHVRNIFEKIATKNPGLIDKFGGHAMAAGVSIQADKIDAFSEAFVAEVEEQLSASQIRGEVETDGSLSADDYSLEVAELVKFAAPWGQNFPEPMFDAKLDVIEQEIVGFRHLRFLFRVPNTDKTVEGIYFNIDPDEWPNDSLKHAEVIFKLDVNEYKRQRNVQLIVSDILPV